MYYLEFVDILNEHANEREELRMRELEKARRSAMAAAEGELVCEQGRWSLPGGWCEYNLSPVDSTIKEVKEEAGLDVEVERVIAVQDRDKHNQPPYVYGIVKIFYQCRVLGGAFRRNIETSGSRYFGEEEIPVLSTERCSEEQIRMCFEACRAENWTVRFD